MKYAILAILLALPLMNYCGPKRSSNHLEISQQLQDTLVHIFMQADIEFSGFRFCQIDTYSGVPFRVDPYAQSSHRFNAVEKYLAQRIKDLSKFPFKQSKYHKSPDGEHSAIQPAHETTSPVEQVLSDSVDMSFKAQLARAFNKATQDHAQTKSSKEPTNREIELFYLGRAKNFVAEQKAALRAEQKLLH